MSAPDAAAGARRPSALPLLPLFLLLAALYAGTAAGFARTWWGRDDYSHGFLVPLVSAWLVWLRRDRLRVTAVRPDLLAGLSLLVPGFLLLVGGRLGSLVAAEQASVLLVVPGFVLALWGRAVLRALILPVGYLVLMVPAVIDPLIVRLNWPLQLFGASCAAALLRLAGVPVARDAQLLTLPNVTLEVASVCSGVRYLISITALSLPMAHVMLRRAGERVALVASALLIGVFANPLRIALIGVWVTRRGPSQIHGPGHVLHGFFVALVGFAFLFAVAAGLARLERRRRAGGGGESPAPPAPAARPEPLPATPPGPGRWVAAFAVPGLAAAALLFWQPRPAAFPPPLSTLPRSVGEWRGTAAPTSQSPLRLEEADAELERVYRSADGHEVRLYVGWLGGQKQGRELVYYTSQKVYDRSAAESVAGAGGAALPVSTAALPGRAGGQRALCYWFDLGGWQTGSPLLAKVRTATVGIATRRTAGALVALSEEVGGESEVPAALERLRGFARQAHPAIAAVLRGEAAGGTP